MAARRPAPAPLRVIFRKQPVDAPADAIACIRADGSRTEGLLPRQGVLPVAAVRFVVEGVLGWRDGLFGRIAGGAPFDPPPRSRGGSAADSSVARQSEALAECLQADQWGGASDPVEFARRLAAACRRLRVEAPVVAAEDLVRVRAALREFGASWRPLTPGGVVERPF